MASHQQLKRRLVACLCGGDQPRFVPAAGKRGPVCALVVRISGIRHIGHDRRSKAIPPNPHVIALDVNETLSDMAPLSQRFEQVGAPPHLRATWFASTLRDGFALTAAGGYADFREVAHAALQTILASVPQLARDRPRGRRVHP
jgi:hypothetical protein